MENVQLYTYLIFEIVTFLTIYFFYLASNKNNFIILALLIWILFQGILSYSGFYLNTDTIPPRMMLIAIPALLAILISFFSKKALNFYDSFNLKTLTLLHIIRIPVELVLYWLFLAGSVPELMTFEGRNFDILAGISSPIIYYFAFVKKIIPNKFLLVWNIFCLALLINIVINGVLSIPSPIQQFAYDQPNIALLHFPFVWLPCCIVPIVMLSHVISIRKLLTKD